MDHTQDPIMTKHAKERAHQRFGIPLSQAQSWITRKLQGAEYIGQVGTGHAYENGGVRLVLKGRLVVSVTQVE